MNLKSLLSKASDCAACGAAGLAGAANVDGGAITTEADMGPIVPGGLKKKKKAVDGVYQNPGDKPQREQFASDEEYKRACNRWEYALQQYIDRPCDFKVQDQHQENYDLDDYQIGQNPMAEWTDDNPEDDQDVVSRSLKNLDSLNRS